MHIFYICVYIYTRWGKRRFIVVSMQTTEFILVLLFINYCIIFHTKNCKPPLAPPCVWQTRIHGALTFCNLISAFVSNYLSKMFVWPTTLGDRNTVFLWDRRQRTDVFMLSRIKKMFLSAWVGSEAPPLKDCGFRKSGFLMN